MRIAAAQARPARLDPDATTCIVVDHPGRAAADRVDLLALPETFPCDHPEETGHYSRPDVFRVQVDRRRPAAAEVLDA